MKEYINFAKKKAYREIEKKQVLLPLKTCATADSNDILV